MRGYFVLLNVFAILSVLHAETESYKPLVTEQEIAHSTSSKEDPIAQDEPLVWAEAHSSYFDMDKESNKANPELEESVFDPFIISSNSTEYTGQEILNSSPSSSTLLELSDPYLKENTLHKEKSGESSNIKRENRMINRNYSKQIVIDFFEVFTGSPTIYTLLLGLSIASFAIWIHALFSLRTRELLPYHSIQEIKLKLIDKEYDAALDICTKNSSILFQIVALGIQLREKDPRIIQEAMKSEGKRMTHSFWQKVSLLNEIAVIAPMLGLLGTVLGMFYAFYDLNRSIESISALFDGLGISVGTTVGGLVVALFALIFHAIAKYRLTKQLSLIETEAVSLTNLIIPY